MTIRDGGNANRLSGTIFAVHAGKAALTEKMPHAKLSIYLLNVGEKLDDGSVRRDER